MSDSDEPRRDPRSRPPDPAGTQPKHDPASLLPVHDEPLLAEPEVVEVDVVEDTDAEPSLLPARRTAPGAPTLAHRHASTKWTPRFHFLLGALVAVGAAAIAAIVILAVNPSPERKSEPEPRWSTWAPTARNTLGAQQIAQHVAASYRHSDGRQIVQVSASPLEIEGIPLAVAVRRRPEDGGEIETFDDGGLIYRLCGLGPECAIATGKATPQRHLLLRREALELALYSFRYLGVKSVVVFMPPPPGETPTQALFFRDRDIAAQLSRPLAASLAAKVPTATTAARSPDAGLVEEITQPKIFTFSFTRANADSKGFIVLDPLNPTQATGSGSASTTRPADASATQ